MRDTPLRILAHEVQKHGWREGGSVRALKLNKGRVSGAFTVWGGPCVILAMYLEITEAVPATGCNMSWVLRSDVGGYRVIGDTVDITGSALGDFYWAELDGTNIVKATTSVGLIHNGFNRTDTKGFGTLVTQGTIDVVLGTNNLTAGAGKLYVYYKPLMHNACIVAEDMRTSTTSSTTSSTSSSSTASTASTTSSTSSTASTTSSTSSTASTASTASSTSSTTSTSSTASTASTASTTSTTTSTTSTTSTTTTAAP